MFGFDSSSGKERFFALYDIDSAGIGVGVVWSDGLTNKLVWSKRVDFGYHSPDDYNRYVRTMYATLLEVGMKMVSEGFKSTATLFPSFSARKVEVVCVLGQPWFIGFVSTETYTKEKPFQITPSLVEEIQNEGLSKVIAKQESVSWQNVMGTPKLLEVYTDSVRLEGYPVQSYLRRTVKDLQVQFYFGIVSESVQDHIEEVLKRVLPNHEIVFLTSTRVFSILERQYANNTQKRSVLIEVSGEITSVSILKNGVVMGIHTIPQGTNHILKIIAPHAASAEEARSVFEIFRKKNAQSDFSALPSELQETLVSWKSDIIKNINVLSEGVTPPAYFVIVVDTSWYLFYKLSIEKLWEIPGVRISVDSEVRQIGQSSSVDEKKTTVSTEDTRLALLTRLLPLCTEEKGMCYTENNK